MFGFSSHYRVSAFTSTLPRLAWAASHAYASQCVALNRCTAPRVGPMPLFTAFMPRTRQSSASHASLSTCPWCRAMRPVTPCSNRPRQLPPSPQPRCHRAASTPSVRACVPPKDQGWAEPRRALSCTRARHVAGRLSVLSSCRCTSALPRLSHLRAGREATPCARCLCRAA